jgi:hypothetical protein
VALYLAGNAKIGWGIAVVAFLIVAGAVIVAKSRPIAVGENPEIEQVLEHRGEHHDPSYGTDAHYAEHHAGEGDGGQEPRSS